MKIPMALWPRLMPLLDEALAQPREQREAWLRDLTLDDETRAALKQLLADREELDGGAFMAELPKLAPLASAPSPSPFPSPDGPHEPDEADARSNRVSQSGLFAGDMLGPYRLIKPLGQGGMSVVWLAERDDGQIRRQVALKMPHAGPGQALLAERLRRERDILASLEHRHIARLYDVGTAPTGLPFMVLEYIEGLPLPAYCDEHRLNLYERLKLFLQVLSAVQYAHTKLVLHRDLKPSNILVNREGEVKLLDFGIAKLIRDSETGLVAPSTELTQHNGHVLTPDYAAPEQIAGQPLTTASDVYALGVILFELLTGQRPYRLPRGTRGALEEAILVADARRPSQVWLDADVQTHHPTAVTVSDLAEHFRASPRRLSQLLRGDLDVIVATALQKQATRRYPTAEAFAQDIQHHLAKEPIAAQPDSRWYRTRKYIQRHAWALSAVGAVVAALSVGLGLALWQAKEARQEAAKANAIKDFLVGLFENGDVEQPDALRKRQQTVEQLLINSANALGTQLKDQPEVRVELQGVVGGLLHSLAITDEAIKLRKQRLAQLEAMRASVAERAQALRELADSQDARGDTQGARATLDRGLALCRAAQMQPATVCYGLQVARGQMEALARNIEVAEREIAPALKVLERQRMPSTQYAEALVGMGDILSLKGQADTSYALYKEAMRVRTMLWGANSIRLAKERFQLAMSLGMVRRLSQADEELHAALTVMTNALGREHLSTATVELQLGRLHALLGTEQDAHALIEHAGSVILKHRGEADARTVVDALWAQGESALFEGRMSDASASLNAAMTLHRSADRGIPRDGLLEITMAWYLIDMGQYQAARQLLLHTRDALFGATRDASSMVHAVEEAIASSYLAEQRFDDAKLWLMRASRLDTSVSNPSPLPQVDYKASWAALYLEQGKLSDAEPFVRAYMDAITGQARGDTFVLDIYASNDLAARMALAQGHPRDAKKYFERAIEALAKLGPGNPYLAVTRSRYAEVLHLLGDQSASLHQLSLAQIALKRCGTTAAHFWRVYQRVEKRVAS
ncbi:hypothetical protein JY96_11895 [Aquabacterium sp. NJ1]|uniref:serine/threonine-protein kinase n=1 Tax=Aquabacterium sp. NJ1 TaxID=1538295 RepID=UPI00052C7100|nr:serine/threonine-protein kinase [Aquabacterium sp. NJ1]KGM40502.1 hypothetical protein JY96_11895 [Aquabacterium sp. NJ1]